MYKKIVINGYILGVALVKTGGNITEEEYQEIAGILQQMPEAPEGYVYKLKDASLEWELVEIQPVPEPDLSDSEVIEILLGGES